MVYKWGPVKWLVPIFGDTVAMIRITNPLLDADPELRRRFEAWLKSSFIWARKAGCVNGPYTTRRPYSPNRDRTAKSGLILTYWKLYGHFEGVYSWLLDEHVLIQFLEKDYWPSKGRQVDHKDHDGLNNTFDNLDFTTTWGNHQNTRSSTKGYVGVKPNGDGWQARTSSREPGGKNVSTYYGTFKTYREAAEVSKAAREKLGRYAPPIPNNLPDGS